MRIAAIDLGSNTVKMTVAHWPDGASVQPIEERAEITRIGERLDETGRLEAAAMERTLATLRGFRDLAAALGVARLGCVATAGLRGAENSAEFCERVREELGFEVEIIDGLREADLAYRAARAGYGPGVLLVADIGGRSTELILGAGDAVESRISLPIGSVRLTERYVRHDPPLDEELKNITQHAADELEQAPNPAAAVCRAARLVGVSGTVMSVMGVFLGTDDIQEAIARGEGQVLERSAVDAIFDDLRRKTTAERLRGTVIPPGRADVIVAGVAILRAILDRYGARLIASNRGVRFGLLETLRERV